MTLITVLIGADNVNQSLRTDTIVPDAAAGQISQQFTFTPQPPPPSTTVEKYHHCITKLFECNDMVFIHRLICFVIYHL